MSFSWWFGEIIITGQLWRGRRQCHQYPECICTAAAAEGKTLIVRETVQTLEVEKEENQRQVPGSFQRYDANVCLLLMLKIEHGFSSSTLATSCGKISVASSLSLQSYLLVVFVVWHHQVVVIKIITLLLIIHQQPLASLLYSAAAVMLWNTWRWFCQITSSTTTEPISYGDFFKWVKSDDGLHEHLGHDLKLRSTVDDQ